MKHFIVNPGAFGVTEWDIDRMFGPLDPGDEVVPTEVTDLSALAVEATVFPSRGQARKNGLGGTIPHGLHYFGTKKHRFWVWSPIPPTTGPSYSPAMEHSARWFQEAV